MKRSHSPELRSSRKRVQDIVKLNVGGRIFDTTAMTLAMAPYFAPFLEGRMEHGTDENGRLFIDRDGSVFSYLLNFMRTTKLHMPQSMIEERRRELLDECEYFALDWLAHRIDGEISPFHMRPEDRKIRDEEMLGNCSLLDVFETDLSLKPTAELQCPCLPCCVDRPSLSTTSYIDFRKNFDDMIGGWLTAVSEIEGLCFAGGSVIGTLLGCTVGDVDIFAVTGKENGKHIFDNVLAAIRKAHSKRYGDQAKLLITRSRHALTVFQAISDRPGGKPIQVVLSCYESVLHLLREFDLDSCAFAFVPSQKKVWCTPRGKRAVIYSANVVDSRFDSPGYVRRLEKYDARGFRIAIPGFDDRLVSRSFGETSYLYLHKYDLCLRLCDGRDRGKQDQIEITKNDGRSFKKVQVTVIPACTQSAVAVKGVRRLAVMKYGYVETFDAEICAGKKQGKTMSCLPLRAANGKYSIIWLPRDCEDEPVEGYSGGTQAECVERLLEAHVDLRMCTTDSPNGFEWWSGGSLFAL